MNLICAKFKQFKFYKTMVEANINEFNKAIFERQEFSTAVIVPV